MDASQMVMVGDQQVNLSELAGINMDAVAEKRMENFDAGRFRFRLAEGKFGAAGTGEDAKAVCRFTCECLEVFACSPPENEAKWVGKKHNESIFITEPEDMGRIKAFLIDCGHKATPGHSFQQNLDAAVGLIFDATIVKTPNKKNPDGDPFTNLRKIKPVVELPTGAPVATAAA